MKKSLLTLLLLGVITVLYGQIGDDPPEPSTLCDNAPVVCNLAEIDGYEATMVTNISPQPQPSPLCPGQGNTAAHNIVWFGFVAGSDYVQLSIDVSECTGGGGNPGVQAGIYTDCNFTSTVDCQGQGQTGPFTLQGPVNPGQTYYVFIDGNSASVCYVVIDILQGGEVYEVPDPDPDLAFEFSYDGFLDCPGPCSEVCLGGEIQFEIPVMQDGQNVEYYWTIDPPTSDYPDGIIDLENYFGQVNFNEVGTFEICSYGYTPCDTSDISCVTFTVLPTPVEEFDDYYVCENEFSDPGPPGWLGNSFSGPGYYENTVESAAYSCDYIQTITVIELPLPDPEYVSILSCPGENTVQICDQFFASDQTGVEIVCPGGAGNGCDSTVIADIAFVNVIGFLADPICENGMLTFMYNGIVTPANADDIIWTLYLDGNPIENGNGNPNLVGITVPLEEGEYWLEFEISHFGQSCYFDDLDHVDFTNTPPDAPMIAPWSINPCVLDSIPYSLAPGANPNWDYQWEILPNDPGLEVVTAGNNIAIDWSTSSFGMYTICVSAFNGCQNSEEQCQTINVLSAPIASYEMADTICVNNETQIVYDGTVLGSGSYNWSFDGGMVEQPGTNNPGPFDVTYTTTGLKYITLDVSEGSCFSALYIDSIYVVPPLNAPLINCSSSTDSIGFSWGDIVNSDGFDIDVITTPAGANVAIGTNTVDVTGLTPGESVTIAVTTIDPGFCMNAIDTITCVAIDCPPIDVEIDEVDTICLVNGVAPINLSGQIDPLGAGDVIWAGTGITDPATGVFDPNVATPGTHQIVLTYQTECAYTDVINIVVLEQPKSNFTVKDTTCILNAVNVNFNGTFPNAEFIWDFDGATINSGSDEGPYNIQWSTPGLKTITSMNINQGCASEMFTEQILVEPAIEPVIIDCSPSTNDITFTWDPVANATEYEVIVNGTSEGIQTGTSFFVDGLVPGNMVQITVVANSDNSCPSSTSVYDCTASLCPTVTIDLVPDDNNICLSPNSPPVNINAVITGGNNAAILTWSGPGMDMNGNFDPKIAGVGVHDIVFDYTFVNCNEVETIQMIVNPTPVAAFDSDVVICVSDILDLNFTGTYVSDPNFVWDLDGATLMPTGNPDVFQASFTEPGVYDFSLVLDEFGCTSDPFTSLITVEEPLQEPTFSCSSTTTEVVFSWNPVDCAAEYIVSINGVVVGTQTGTSYPVDGLSEGEMVDLEITAISECSCGDEVFATSCSANDCPDIGVNITSVDPICFSPEVSDIQLAVNTTGTDGSEETEWVGQYVSNNGMFDVQAAGPGTYTVLYNLTSQNCDFADEVTVVINDTPDADVSFINPSCPGDLTGSIEITPEGGDGNYTVSLNNQVITEYENIVDLPASTYTIEIIDGQGCIYNEVGSLIDPVVQDVDIKGVNTIVLGDSTTLTLNTTVDPSLIDNIIWLDTMGNQIVCSGDISCLSIDVAPNEDINYCVTMTYNGGCVIEDCFELRVERLKRVYIPNVFSPNGDNLNDQFFINVNDEVESIPIVQVYSRWGEKVYELEDVQLKNDPESWDGQFKGRNLNPGVYVYLVKVEYTDGTKEILTGDVTIVK